MRKIQRHPNDSVSQPPSSGPTAAAPEMTAPHTPNAAARSLPRNTALTVDRVAGSTSAPPMPWTSRALMSPAASPEVEAHTLPATKTVTPATNIVRRPSRSPRRPEVRSSAAKITE